MEYYPAMKGGATVLVCGGAGFIGSNFIRYVLKENPKMKVVCLDAFTYAGNRDNLKGLPRDRFVLIKGDITDRGRVTRTLAIHEPEYVINFAAESHVDRSIHGGAETFVHTNVLGTTVLLDAVQKSKHSIRKYVQVSTDEVYGALELKSKNKFTEHSPLAPNSPYAASKAAADLVVRSFFVTFGLPTVITRCSNNYGPYQHPEKLIPFSINRLIEGKPVAIYGDGKYVRDWIHVEDHSAALLLALLKGEPGEIYNIGADDEVNNLTIAKALLKCFHKNESSIQYVADRPGHDRRYAINSHKIQRELGWKPKHTLTRSLSSTVDWYTTHVAWVRRAIRRAGASNTHI